jgi:hypothetical protein
VSVPLPCRPGTYGNTSGLSSINECISCDGGYYCNGFALTTPAGPCNNGKLYKI